MYSTTFIFASKEFDAEFHRLDRLIAETARLIPGYIGEETWENPSTGLTSNVYYWESLEALQVLVKNPVHLQAKAAQSNWLDGYQVIISQVLKIYGDNTIGHCLPPTQSSDSEKSC